MVLLVFKNVNVFLYDRNVHNKIRTLQVYISFLSLFGEVKQERQSEGKQAEAADADGVQPHKGTIVQTPSQDESSKFVTAAVDDENHSDELPMTMLEKIEEDM